MIRIRHSLFRLAWVPAALLIAACTAPAPTPDAPAATPPPVAGTSAPIAATPAMPPPTLAAPIAGAEPAPGTAKPPIAGAADPTAPSRACRTDADCAVKDVGNCCGTYPMCVHKDAPVDPKAVQAQCARQGMSSICGFREVRGCTCVEGQCQDIADGEVAM